MQWQGFAPQLKIHFNQTNFQQGIFLLGHIEPCFWKCFKVEEYLRCESLCLFVWQSKIHCCWMLVTAMGQNTNTLQITSIAQVYNYYIIARIHCWWMQVTPIGHKSAVADRGCLIRMRHDPTFPR